MNTSNSLDSNTLPPILPGYSTIPLPIPGPSRATWWKHVGIVGGFVIGSFILSLACSALSSIIAGAVSSGLILVGGLLAIASALAFVFSPTYFAWKFHHKHVVSITVLNVLIGWTGLFVFILLFWSLLPIYETPKRN